MRHALRLPLVQAAAHARGRHARSVPCKSRGACGCCSCRRVGLAAIAARALCRRQQACQQPHAALGVVLQQTRHARAHVCERVCASVQVHVCVCVCESACMSTCVRMCACVCTASACVQNWGELDAQLVALQAAVPTRYRVLTQANTHPACAPAWIAPASSTQTTPTRMCIPLPPPESTLKHRSPSLLAHLHGPHTYLHGLLQHQPHPRAGVLGIALLQKGRLAGPRRQ